MIGDVDLATAREAVDDAFGGWKSKSRSAGTAIGAAPEPRPGVILVHHPDAVQSTILAGHTIAPFDAAATTELSIMNAVFGGNFESRINMNLREDKAWSYGMRSGLRQNRSGDQYLAVSGSVQTDKTMESMQEIMREYQDYLTTRPATEAEVERMKLNMTRSLPGLFATNVGFLNSMVGSDSFGLPYDYAERRGERLAAITTEAVVARARAVIEPDKLTWMIVGDLEQIEEKVRSLNYGDVEVWDAFGERIR
jgi:zinc protease